VSKPVLNHLLWLYGCWFVNEDLTTGSCYSRGLNHGNDITSVYFLSARLICINNKTFRGFVWLWIDSSRGLL